MARKTIATKQSSIPKNPDKPIVLCLVRNAGHFIPAFFDHYLGLGFEEFVFFDNGSTDSTLDLLSIHPGVTILTTPAPYSVYQRAMQHYLVAKFGRGRWSLSVDVDEHFDFPGSDSQSLVDFTGSLEAKGWNAVVAHQLDMFGDVDLTSESRELNTEEYCYYSLDEIVRASYASILAQRVGPIPKNDGEQEFLLGGVRRAVFGGMPWLSKTPLVFFRPPMQPMLETHFVANAVLAGVSCVLYHYKLVSGLLSQVEEATQRRHYQNMLIYDHAAKTLKSNPNGINLAKHVSSKKILTSISDLSGTLLNG